MRISGKFNAAGGVADFWQEFRRPNPYRWPILAASALLTGSLVGWVFWEDYFVPPPPPKVVFIKTLPAGRSDAEIVADNRANQIVKEREAAEQARRDAEVRDIYKTLGRATGMDVDRIEAEAAAERAREEAAARAGTSPGRVEPNAQSPVQNAASDSTPR